MADHLRADALESEYAPCECVAEAFELPGKTFADVAFELPGLQARRFHSRLQVRHVSLGWLPDANPLDVLRERRPGGVCLVDVAKEDLLELVTVLDVRAVPQALNEFYQDRLCGQMPRKTSTSSGC